VQSVCPSRSYAAELDLATTPLGATFTKSSTTFLVWAPNAHDVHVHIVAPRDRRIPMRPNENGYFHAIDFECQPGDRYYFSLDGRVERPDPASRLQPQGVHGPSEIVRQHTPEQPQWCAPALRDFILYEIHTGTFTPEGTLDAIIPELDRLKALGITAVEIMPVAEFPGGRNWGYDGVFPFAVEQEYGGPESLHRLVQACHERGMAIVLDVVYNHLGPEGNYLADFGPYFTDRYRTPWGEAINFDGRESDHVRRFFLDNAFYWVRDFGIDALRLDAVHAIIDRSARPFLAELASAIHAYARESGRNIYLMAESDLNDARLIRPREEGGDGFDAQWSDDFHHGLHTLLTGERSGYYADFGGIEHLAAALQNGWTYSGQYSAFRRMRFGNSPEGLSCEQFIVCSQNHDQAGNRMKGERLSHLVDWERAKLAAAAVLLSPFTPLLFMGEEYAEPAPFLYHVSHSDPELQRAVCAGRKAEFKEFMNFGEPPDPQSENTFCRSKLRTELARVGLHGVMHAFYAELIRIRRALAHMRPRTPGDLQLDFRQRERVVQFGSRTQAGAYRVVLNFDSSPHTVESVGPPFQKVFDSADSRWWSQAHHRVSGDAAEPMVKPLSCAVFVNEGS
jgi:maltooligosyltrehalose trehalohydrolase